MGHHVEEVGVEEGDGPYDVVEGEEVAVVGDHEVEAAEEEVGIHGVEVEVVEAEEAEVEGERASLS